MVSINTNLSSLIAQNSLKSSTNKLNTAVERMSTGYKINHAKDNAAAYSIITQMDTKIGAYQVAEDNCAMGLDMITTANESLSLIQDKLTQLRDLQEQASNGTYGEQSLKAINSEANALVDEINRLYETAEYNGKKLFGTDDATPASEPIATFAMTRATSFDGLKRVSEADSIEANKSYRIDDAIDFKALQDFVNGGGDTTNVTFELTSDINMQGESFRGIGINSTNSFKGTFNGNGHVIKNLTIEVEEDSVGLFGYTNGAIIDSLGVDNCTISGKKYVGALVGFADSSSIINSYATGSVTGSDDYLGGMVGNARDSLITNSYTTCNVTGTAIIAGGFVGSAKDVTITNCYATGNVSADLISAGFLGETVKDVTITNCYATGKVNARIVSGFATDNTTLTNCACVRYDSYATVMTEEELNAIYTPELMGFTEDNGWTIVDGTPKLIKKTPSSDPDMPSGVGGGSLIVLQVGMDSSLCSQVGVDLSFMLNGVDDLRGIGIDKVTDYFTILDNMLSTVAAKQVTYGAAQNRLESALDEIETQRTNLVSSRSTLRDADIAEVSSQYIQQQILQQASATLLSTANQSPSIALQLI